MSVQFREPMGIHIELEVGPTAIRMRVEHGDALRLVADRIASMNNRERFLPAVV